MLLTAACLVASVIIPDASDLKSVADRVHETVVQVRGSTGESGTYATGVLVGPRLVVTPLHSVAAHVGSDGVVPLPQIAVLLQGQGVTPAQMVAADVALDLALLRLPDDAPALEPVPFAAEDPVRGEQLIAMGAGENEVQVVDVTVASVHGDVFALASRHPLDSRFWGGPLFDVNGRLAAIELTALGEPRAVPARVVRAWVQRATVRN